MILTHAGRRWGIGTVLPCLALCGALVGTTTTLAARPVDAASQHSSAWVRTTHSVPALPRGSQALRAVAPATVMSADVVLKPRDPAALAAFATAVSTPGSPSFRHYLAPGTFGRVFGPTAATIASARAWLAGRGLSLGPTAADGLVIPVSATAARMGPAFDIGLEQYRLPSGRVAHVPNAEPLVPAALASEVGGVVGLDDLSRPVPELARAAPGRAALVAGPSPRASGPTPTGACQSSLNSSIQSAGAFTADKLAQAYSFSGLYAGGTEGAGVTLGLYELEPFLPANIDTFKACYSPAITASVTGVMVHPGVDPIGGSGQGESALDIEMAIGMAPNVNVKVYVGPNAGVGPLETYLAMVNDLSPASVISTSWGQCEAQIAPALVQVESSIFQQAVAQGQTVIAAAGDEGSEDCFLFPSSNDTRLQVDDPASQPWVTGVGGTTVSSIGPPTAESVWNTGLFAGTGGGGTSTTWTMPAWQRGPGVQSAFTRSRDSFTGAQPCATSSGPGTGSCRQVPDVAAAADPRTGYAVFCSCFGGNHWAKIGGTSMSSPMWGALVALADQGQPSTVGFLNPALYQAQCAGSAVFNDVTTGNNQALGSQPSNPPHLPPGPYYPATPNYDLATGLGTPVASSLVGTLRAPPPNTCPVVTGISTSSGPAAGGPSVTVSGSHLSGVSEVDFGIGNPALITAVTPTSVTVTLPPSPTRGWASADVLVRAGNDVLGYDGSTPFTYIGPRGYWMVASDGGVFSFGQMGFFGSTGGRPLNQPIVGIASTPSSSGYWLVASDGGIFAFGDAGFFGSTGSIHLSKPVVGMASTPDGGGYWLVASDGGIFAFGDAGFFGSTGATPLNKPVVGMASTPDGAGYWLVASDGGIFAFGDAGFFGSTGAIRLNKPVVGMAATPDGAGYWLVASDGGIFAFGDAGFHGSTGATPLNKPVVGMASTPDGNGYWLVASDGGVFAFGGQYGGFFGSMGGSRLNKPMVGIGAP